MKSSWDVEGDNDGLVRRYNNQQGGTEKTEQEGNEGTAIVAATMEEKRDDIEVGVGIERTSPPPFGAGKN